MLTRKNGTVLPFHRVQALLYVIGNSRKNWLKNGFGLELKADLYEPSWPCAGNGCALHI